MNTDAGNAQVVHVEILLDNRLVGSHVFRKGDVVAMPVKRAKEWVRAQHGAITHKEPTPLPMPGPPRSQQIGQREQAASNPAPSRAERAVQRPRPAIQA